MALDLVQVSPAQPLPLLFACARLTSMETPQPVMLALLVPMVASAMPKQLLAAPSKLSLHLACVLKAAGELIPLLLLHAQLALLAGLPSLLVVRLLLLAIDATPTILEMLPPLMVLLAAQRVLPIPRVSLAPSYFM